MARMHNHVAALEKFQLAATGLEAARSSANSKQLEELSSDVAASGEALAEIEMGEMATKSVIEVVVAPKALAAKAEPDAESGAMA